MKNNIEHVMTKPKALDPAHDSFYSTPHPARISAPTFIVGRKLVQGNVRD
jgi:hypothetical protein